MRGRTWGEVDSWPRVFTAKTLLVFVTRQPCRTRIETPDARICSNASLNPRRDTVTPDPLPDAVPLIRDPCGRPSTRRDHRKNCSCKARLQVKLDRHFVGNGRRHIECPSPAMRAASPAQDTPRKFDRRTARHDMAADLCAVPRAVDRRRLDSHEGKNCAGLVAALDLGPPASAKAAWHHRAMGAAIARPWLLRARAFGLPISLPQPPSGRAAVRPRMLARPIGKPPPECWRRMDIISVNAANTPADLFTWSRRVGLKLIRKDALYPSTPPRG